MRLGKYKRDSSSIQREGENIQAVWSPDAKLIAVIVSLICLPILPASLFNGEFLREFRLSLIVFLLFM